MIAATASLIAVAPAAAMTGGITQNPEPRWAVRLDERGVPNCTGTLIAPRWILTAAHCLDGTTKAVTSARLRGVRLRAEAIYVHPDYREVRNGVHSDVALVKLPVDAVAIFGARTLPLGTADDLSYFTNRGVTLFGYGVDESRKMTSTIKKSPDHAWSLARFCQVPGARCFVRAPWAANRTAVRDGDSGGPWVGWRNGGWRVLSVVSGYIPGTRLQYGTSPAAAGAANWIRKLVWPTPRPQTPPVPKVPIATAPPAPAPPVTGAPKPTATNLIAVNHGGGHVGVAFDVGWQPGRDPVTCHFFRNGVEVFTAQCGTRSSKPFYDLPPGRHTFYATVSDQFGVYSDRSNSASVDVAAPPPLAVSDRLSNDGRLSAASNQFLRSPDGRYRFVMQSDSNLVLYGPSGRALWASNTAGRGANHLRMQGDGNMVIYNGANSPIWASNTPRHYSSYLVVQNDGNVVIYNGSTPIWATGTAGRI